MNYYEQNRKRLLDLLEVDSITLLSSGQLKHKTQDQFYPFQVNKQFFYLTGITQENCILLIVKGKSKNQTYLFIEETTDFMRQWIGEKMSKEEAYGISGINQTNIMWLSQFDRIMTMLMSESNYMGMGELNTLYLDLYRPVKGENPISYHQFKNILDMYRELTVKNINHHLSYLRMFKSDDEIVKIKEAIRITNYGLNRIMKELKNRDNEHQVDADYNHEIDLNGADGIAFDTILASGVNGCVLHYEDNNSPLNDGELLLCDLGALKNEYGADISRTYPINGKYTDRQKQIYNIVLKANKECIEFIKPGITLKELHQKSREILGEECVRIGLIKEVNEVSKYYYHNVTHFLGLDTHDVGVSGTVLKPGMVLTVEPGLYIKEECIGIRIEDDVLVTEDGSINLSSEIIKEVKDIEAFMKE